MEPCRADAHAVTCPLVLLCPGCGAKGVERELAKDLVAHLRRVARLHAGSRIGLDE